jgi:hypothetical protein
MNHEISPFFASNPCVIVPLMSDSTYNNPTPQFGTAEYVGVPDTDHCQYCHQPTPQTYYRVNEEMACSACAEKMRGELAKDTPAAFMRGLLFGIGAAIVGMILYAAFAITTGIIIGYVSLAVGWMVGKAIIKGSGGVGGRRYQIAAVILTYCAVSMAAVPIWIHYAREHKLAQQQSAATQQQLQQDSGQPTQAVASPANVERPSLVALVVKLAMIGVASPFLELWETGPNFSWIIGMVILLVGIRIAWRITAAAPLAIDGPFANSPQPAP